MPKIKFFKRRIKVNIYDEKIRNGMHALLGVGQEVSEDRILLQWNGMEQNKLAISICWKRSLFYQ